jgi:hypothetical protein
MQDRFAFAGADCGPTDFKSSLRFCRVAAPPCVGPLTAQGLALPAGNSKESRTRIGNYRISRASGWTTL